MKSISPETSDSKRLGLAMLVRRWFLILAVPIVLFGTIAAFLQWRAVWQWFVR